MPTIDQIRNTLESKKQQAHTTLGEFTERLARTPLQAFVWSEPAIHAAASLEVVDVILANLEPLSESTVGDVEFVQFLDGQAMMAIKNGLGLSRSTSLMANAGATAKADVWMAIWFDKMQGMRKHFISAA